MKIPKVIGHRGASFYAPENTLAALYKAAELGVSWIEFDVMLTADGYPIIIHDETLNRTTNGQGKVAETSFRTIRALDAGSWFSNQFMGEKVPTLSEFLIAAKECNLGVNIEIKPTPGKEIATAKSVVALLGPYFFSHHKLLISSFSVQSLETVREMSAELPLGLLLDEWVKGWEQTVDSLKCISLNVDYKMLTADKVREAKQFVAYVLAYTVDDVDEAGKLYEWGVDAVFSNCPQIPSLTSGRRWPERPDEGV